MGREVKRRLSRTSLAAILTAVGVMLPCGAWLVAGSKAAREKAARIEQEPVSRARQEAQRLAQQVAMRLESLRQSESRRSHIDYQRLDRSKPADCSYPDKISPLAQGPADPLIWTHFEINEVGELSLPSLDLPSANGPPTSQLAIFDELECAATARLAAMRKRPNPSEARLVQSAGGVTTVGPFHWHTVSIQERPALVALREVTTPTAGLAQGFVLLASSMDTVLEGPVFPARVRPRTPDSLETAASLPMGDNWVVETDPSDATAAAAAEARAVTRRFAWTFGGGSLAALVAGVLLVGLVRKVDRLASHREQFAASAAHELRTPLAGLRLYGEMLADGTGDRAQHRTYARRIADEVDRLGRVVSNVLGFSRLQRGGLAVRSEPGDLTAAIKESVERLRPALEAKGAHLELSVEANGQRALFDPDAVHQILQNLLDNAEKYTRSSSDRTIRVLLGRDNGSPTLAVVDRGPGVDPAAGRHLFEPFARNTDPDAPAGLGIGLALVAGLARAQNATVSHTTREPGETRFQVTFQSC